MSLTVFRILRPSKSHRQVETGMARSILYALTTIFATALTAPVPGSRPTLNPNYFQGDLSGFDRNTFDQLISDLNDWHGRRLNPSGDGRPNSAISDPRGLWLNGRVPYIISSTNPKVRAAVEAAINEYHEFTCIRWIPHTNEENYVNIIDTEDGCHTEWLGNLRKGAQKLNLGKNCEYKGIVIHEMMHTLGFWHEQQRIDRDDFIIVYRDNVIDSQKAQYDKAGTDRMLLLGNYDMDSVMHYTSDSFVKQTGLITMKAKSSDRTNFGNEQLSEEDKRKIKLLYKCLGTSSNIADPHDDMNLASVLLRYKFRNANELALMSNDDNRNTLIVEIGKRTGIDGGVLQGKQNTELAKMIDDWMATHENTDPNDDMYLAPFLLKCKFRNSEELAKMSNDDNRNTLIVEINKKLGTPGGELQSKKNSQLVKMISC